MVVKFFSTKKGGGNASINYLLNKERVNNGTAQILKGDEKLTRALINSMTQKHKTCVGCLSFEEPNLSDEIKKELMADFENMLLTPEMKGRYNILWIQHTDKGRLELNFVIPKIDLESKKSFNPYFHKADYTRKDLWTDYVNLKHNFTNPKDPSKQNTIQGSKKEYELIKDYEKLDKFLHEQVSKGNINSRAEMVYLLQDNGISVNRQGKDYISVKLPDSKKAKRFKGGIYDEQFRSITELREITAREKERARAYNKQNSTDELREIKSRLDSHIQSKAEFYAREHKRNALRKQRRAEKIQTNEYNSKSHNRAVDSDNFYDSCVVEVDRAITNSKRMDIQSREQGRNNEPIYNNTKGQRDTTRQRRNEIYIHSQGVDNDELRNRINSRSGEITKRVRKCIDYARNTATIQQQITERVRKFREQIQEFENYIREKFRRIRKLREQKIKVKKQGVSKNIGGRGWW